MSEQHLTEVEVMHVVSFESESEWPFKSGKVSGSIAKLWEILASIPGEHQEDAQIEVSAVSYGEETAYPSVRIWYTRPETEEEAAKRIEHEKRSDEWRTNHELKELERLAKKHPGIVQIKDRP